MPGMPGILELSEMAEILVAQNLERIADLSTNIAEEVVFLVEGRTIKHHVESRFLSDEDDEEPRTDA